MDIPSINIARLYIHTVCTRTLVHSHHCRTWENFFSLERIFSLLREFFSLLREFFLCCIPPRPKEPFHYNVISIFFLLYMHATLLIILWFLSNLSSRFVCYIISFLGGKTELIYLEHSSLYTCFCTLVTLSAKKTNKKWRALLKNWILFFNIFWTLFDLKKF